MVPDRKPRSYRGVFFAAGLAGLALGQAQGEAQSPGNPAAVQQQPSGAARPPIPVEIIERPEAAKARESSEAESAQREKDDLLAQQGMNTATQAMNDATQRMALYALFSTGLVALGTGLLFWTLMLTRQANQAARCAVKVTREMGQRQTRAYLNISEIYLKNFEVGTPLAAVFTIINSGQSPAYICASRASVMKTEQRERLHFTFNTGWERRGSIGANSPTASYAMSHTPVDQEMFDAVMEDRASLVIGIAVRYRDTFGVKRWTIARAYITGSVIKIAKPGGKRYFAADQRNNASN